MNALAEIDQFATYDADLETLAAHKDAWVDVGIKERIKLLRAIKRATAAVAEGWVETAARRKLLPENSPLAGEEWLSGPYGVMSACDALIRTLEGIEGHAFLRDLPKRYLKSGQLAVQTFPSTLWDSLLISGVTAEVWMQPGVTEANLAEHTSTAYAKKGPGKVALVLGAGNIASIAPLDCFQKLFQENQVVLIKMNPVNDYLTDYLRAALKPLIDGGFLRIVKGDGTAGAYLTEHKLVEEIHITGAGATHDLIVWGPGEEGKRAKAAGTPRNTRAMSSELGAVCPTIVVPGPWSDADIAFQAEHIATQKLHNGGFNCVACQVLVMPSDWARRAELLEATKRVIADHTRPSYYPATDVRVDAFEASGESETVARVDGSGFPVARHTEAHDKVEVFAPALSVQEIAGEGEAYLRAAIAFANDRLYGTLGANILIHPATLREIGKRRFEELITGLRYGTIAVNAWTGVGFLTAQATWGAFPGHTLDDVQSGIGVVHNSYMFAKPERTVLRGPWAPFPRSLAMGEKSLLPKPPWFITHRRAHKVGKGLVGFVAKPKLLKLPGIVLSAFRG
ncbi:MAG: aldehyde dehydrogenase family protein [Pseudomonadota bacterium]